MNSAGKKFDADYLRDQILIVLAGPLLLLTLAFAALFIYQGQVDRIEVRQKLGKRLQESIVAQQQIITEELLLHRRDALALRQELLFKAILTDFPSGVVCLTWNLQPDYAVFPAGAAQCSRAQVQHSQLVAAPAIKLNLSDIELGQVDMAYDVRFGFFDYLPPTMLGWLVAAVMFAAILAKVLVSLLDRRIIQPLLARIADQSRDAAMAQTTQMLAHDVRAPLSQLQVFLNMIAKMSDPEKIKAVSVALLPEVERKREKVESMLNDILEFGAQDQNQQREWLSLPDLLNEVLTDLQGVMSERRIEFHYVGINRQVWGHKVRLHRVLTNIINNAIKAMPERGEIHFSATQALSADRVIIGIRNTGSHISPQQIANIFEAFTSSRRGGVGLGLAICRKIVHEHGGQIRCRSDQDEGTTFEFDLKARNLQSAVQLPRISRDIKAHWHDQTIMAYAEASPTETAQVDQSRIDEIRDMARSRGRPLRILVVDDELIYGQSILRVIAELGLDDAISAKYEADPVAALRFATSSDIDAAIVDMNLNHDSIDGVRIANALRDASQEVLICIHSNWFGSINHRQLLQLDVDMILPKPMSLAHLLGFLSIRGRHQDRRDSSGI